MAAGISLTKDLSLQLHITERKENLQKMDSTVKTGFFQHYDDKKSKVITQICYQKHWLRLVILMFYSLKRQCVKLLSKN